MDNWKVLILFCFAAAISTCAAQSGDPCIDADDFTRIPSTESCNVSELELHRINIFIIITQHHHHFQEYFECFDGRAFLVRCPYGLYFSPTQLRCTYYTDANCRLGPPPTPPPIPTQLPPNQMCIGVEDFTLLPSDSSCSVRWQIYFENFIMKCLVLPINNSTR